MIVCNSCWNIFDESVFQIQQSGRECPLQFCFGQVHHMDDLIVPIVKKLTEKGYFVFGAATGRWSDIGVEGLQNTSILLQLRAEQVAYFNNIGLPDKFKLVEVHVEDETPITHSLLQNHFFDDNITLVEQMTEITSSVITLMKWVESLDSVFEIDCDNDELDNPIIPKGINKIRKSNVIPIKPC